MYQEEIDQYDFFSLFHKPYDFRYELLTHHGIIYYNNIKKSSNKLLEILALDEDTLRKVGILKTCKDENGVLWISDVSIAPSYRKRRIATNLILLAIDDTPDIKIPYHEFPHENYYLTEEGKKLVEHCQRVKIINPENLYQPA